MIIAIAVLIFFTIVNTGLLVCLYKVFENLNAQMDKLENYQCTYNNTIIETAENNKTSIEALIDKIIRIDANMITIRDECTNLSKALNEHRTELCEKIEEKYSDIYEQYSQLDDVMNDLGGMLSDIWNEFDDYEDEEDEGFEPPEKLEHIVVDFEGPIYGQMDLDDIVVDTEETETS